MRYTVEVTVDDTVLTTVVDAKTRSQARYLGKRHVHNSIIGHAIKAIKVL